MLQSDHVAQPTRRNHRIRRRRRPPLYWILRGLMIVSFCCFLVFLGQLVIPKIQARSVSNRIPAPGTGSTVQQAVSTPMPVPEAADKTAAPEQPSETEEENDGSVFNTEETAPISEDFLELRSMNPDIMGWLTAADRINYPVVRGEDDSFYLNHNFFGESDLNGSIFLSQYNVMRPRDTILLIYGHYLATGDMFGTLQKYMDESYMRQNALIQFRTVFADETGSDWYVPIAMFSASMDDDEAQYFNIRPVNFETDADFQAYLDAAISRSAWKAPTDVTTDDEMIMLVTCSYNFVNSRHLLLCRRLRADETPEQMRALYLNQPQA